MGRKGSGNSFLPRRQNTKRDACFVYESALDSDINNDNFLIEFATLVAAPVAAADAATAVTTSSAAKSFC